MKNSLKSRLIFFGEFDVILLYNSTRQYFMKFVSTIYAYQISLLPSRHLSTVGQLNFDLTFGSFLTFWALMGYFWGFGRVQKLFRGLLI